MIGVGGAISAVEARVVAAELERRFPGAVVWYGSHTGHWWAIVRHRRPRGELIEAVSPVDLAEAITRTRGAPSAAGSISGRGPSAAAWVGA